jgi:hypothetical protein
MAQSSSKANQHRPYCFAGCVQRRLLGIHMAPADVDHHIRDKGYLAPACPPGIT